MAPDRTPGGDEAPPIPQPEISDLEDVSWALGAAAASWHRGDSTEALKWLRRAAEAATEASANERAIVLAKAAAELASNLGRASMPPTASAPLAPPTSPSVIAATTRSGPPPPSSARPPPPPPSVRPLGLAPRVAQAPAPQSGLRPSTPAPRVAPLVSSPSRQGASAYTNAMHPSKFPILSGPIPTSTLASRGGEGRKRKSSNNLDAEAKAAKSGQPAARAPRQSSTSEARRKRASPAPPTEVEPESEPPPNTSARRPPSVSDEIDAWPTQTMDKEALTHLTGGMARIEALPDLPPTGETSAATVAESPLVKTEAMRVLVWRAPDGVRVVPYGTPVASAAVEAMLVALDPGVDLAAWFSRR